MTGKKTTKNKEIQKEIVTKRRSLSLGDTESDARMDRAQKSEKYMKLDNEKGANIFALVSGGYQLLSEHWFQIKGKKVSCLCGAHVTGDDDIIAKGMSTDICPWCAITMGLYREAKKDRSHPLSKSKKDMANEIRAKVSYIMEAVRGSEGLVKKIKNKRVMTPVFNSYASDYLQLTQAAWEFLRNEFNSQGLNGTDAVGLPVNFERGKKDSKDIYSQVISVSFFPNSKIPKKHITSSLPKIEIEYDAEKAKELAESWLEEYKQSMGVGAGSRSRRRK